MATQAGARQAGARQAGARQASDESAVGSVCPSPKSRSAARETVWQRRAARLGAGLLLLCFVGAPVAPAADRPSPKSIQDSGSLGPLVARIPVTALGFLPPGDLPAFYGYAEVSLHFVDATHLLFAFRIPRLLRRNHLCTGMGSERVVRAVVLDIPSGKVERRTEWKLYDVDDFLWGLGNGQLLLRRCNHFDLLGAALDPQPLIEASGSIDGIRFSPDRSVAVIEETVGEPRDQTVSKGGSKPADHSLQHKARKNVDVEFIRFQPLKVIARARLQTPSSIPVLNDGFLEALPASDHRWMIQLHSFHGKEQKLATVRSGCTPWLDALSHQVIVAGVCSKGGDVVFEGYDRQGSPLWNIPLSSRHILPRFLLTRDGTHFAIESVEARHPMAPFEPLNRKRVRGEKIEVYDTLTGTAIGSLLVQPVYTAGKNADFSPDGTRLAVLNQEAIEIFRLKELTPAR